MYFLAMLVAKLADPIVLLLALVGGASCQKWWQIFLAALVAALISESVLFSIQYARVFDPNSFSIGFLAAAAWVALAFSIKRYRANRKLAG